MSRAGKDGQQLDKTMLVVVDVGARTLAMVQRVVHQLVEVLAPSCVPLFVTDGFKEYGRAILAHFGHWIQPERRQAKGPQPALHKKAGQNTDLVVNEDNLACFRAKKWV
jgi:hypothetical protein